MCEDISGVLKMTTDFKDVLEAIRGLKPHLGKTFTVGGSHALRAFGLLKSRKSKDIDIFIYTEGVKKFKTQHTSGGEYTVDIYYKHIADYNPVWIGDIPYEPLKNIVEAKKQYIKDNPKYAPKHIQDLEEISKLSLLVKGEP